MIKIEITDTDVKTRNFSKDGKDFVFREQQAWIHRDDEKYPVQFKLSLGEGSAYAPGFYSIAPGSFTVDRYNSLMLRRVLVLSPLK